MIYECYKFNIYECCIFVAYINELEPMQRKKTRRQFLDNDIF